MGVCQECLVEIDGSPARRACLTPVDRPVSVRRQTSHVSICSETPPATETPLTPQIAVIGGGPGGMCAALSAASAGADVLLIDERPQLGGQFYKQPLATRDLDLSDHDDRQFRDGRHLIEAVEHSGIKALRGYQVAGVFEPRDLVVTAEGRTQLIRPQLLIVATGAYELGLPFPGWTLPGVITTGAAQTLLRSYRVLAGRRILIAGNGPLNFQVASELAIAGAEIVAVVEAARRPSLSAVGVITRMMATAPDLTIRGAGYIAALSRQGSPIIYAHRISKVTAIGNSDSRRLDVTLQALPDQQPYDSEFDVDTVCLGYGFGPSNELLRTLGCRQIADPNSGALIAERDKNCRTSRDDVFAIGDCARMGGARIAEAEGIVAGSKASQALGLSLPAAQSRKVARARSLLWRHRRFQRALWRLFQPAANVFGDIENNALICRCEELTFGEVKQVLEAGNEMSMGNLKRVTRVGMGRCQGRYCGPLIARMIASREPHTISESNLWAPRPPAKPVRIADLAQLNLPGDR